MVQDVYRAGGGKCKRHQSLLPSYLEGHFVVSHVFWVYPDACGGFQTPGLTSPMLGAGPDAHCRCQSTDSVLSADSHAPCQKPALILALCYSKQSSWGRSNALYFIFPLGFCSKSPQKDVSSELYSWLWSDLWDCLQYSRGKGFSEVRTENKHLKS